MLSSQGLKIPFAAGALRIVVDTTLDSTTPDLSIVDSSGGAVTVTLPQKGTVATGKSLFFSAPSAATNDVSFAVQAGDTLNGVAAPGTVTLPAIDPQGATITAVDGGWRMSVAGDTDPLLPLSDDFGPGGATMSARGFLVHQPGTVAGEAVSGGFANFRITGGGAGGSFWFNALQGSLIYKNVTGPVDMRLRTRVTNNTDTGAPPAIQFQLAGIAVHDPNRAVPATDLNYIHVAGGTVGAVQNQVEWKDTVNSVSAFAGVASVTGAIDPIDLRIVRTVADPNSYQLFQRDPALQPSLASDLNWVPVITVSRAVTPLPATLQCGLMVYGQPAVTDIQQFADEIRYSTPTF